MSFWSKRIMKIKEPENSHYRIALGDHYDDWLFSVKEPTNELANEDALTEGDYLPYLFLYGDNTVSAFYRSRYHSFIKILAGINYPSDEDYFGEDSLLGRIVYSAAKVLDWVLDISHPEVLVNLKGGIVYEWEHIIYHEWRDEKLEEDILYRTNETLLSILKLSDYLIGEMFGDLSPKLTDAEPFKENEDFFRKPSRQMKMLVEMRVEEYISGRRKMNDAIFQIWWKFGKKKRREIYPNLQRLTLMQFANLSMNEL